MFLLDKNSKQPLVSQLYNQIKERILSGEMAKGVRLKSVRAFARELNISRNTVENTYQQLVSEGYIDSKPCSGYFVAALDPLWAAAQEAKADDVVCADASGDDGCIDFNPASLSPDAFPLTLWRKLLAECVEEERYRLSVYSDSQGDSGLRREIKKYLATSRGVSCEPEQIVICAGTAQGLTLLCQILKQTYSAIAMEEPGYYTARSVFCNHSFQILPIAVGPDGIDIRQLKQSAGKVVYVTPSHQFPLGYVMSIANRFKLLQWAEETNGVIIEDDYDSELCYYGQPIPSLQGLNPAGRIVYLGTFSKSLSPALRASYMVLPWPLLAEYKKMFRDYQSPVSLLTQSVLEKFISRGHWERHLRKIRVTYRKKHDAVLKALENTFDNRVSVISKGAGLHIPLAISADLSDLELVDYARKAGVRTYPLSACSAVGTPWMGVRLGFGSVSDEDIEKGIKLLHSAWFTPFSKKLYQ